MLCTYVALVSKPPPGSGRDNVAYLRVKIYFPRFQLSKTSSRFFLTVLLSKSSTPPFSCSVSMSASRRGAVQEQESDESSDEDYVPPEQVEVEDGFSESEGADLEPSSGGDTDLDVDKRKRKRKVKVRIQRGKKRARTDGDSYASDNNDETTSNETLTHLPLKPSAISSTTSPRTFVDSSSPSSPGGQTSAPESLSSIPSPSSKNPLSPAASLGSPSALSAPTTSLSAKPSAFKAQTSSISGLLNKDKKKMSTLAKSQMDWQSYKSTNNLSEEIQQFNKGKGGYLDRKDFLDRTTVREFQSSSK